MRRFRLGVTPILLALSAPAVAQAPQWRVSEVSGDVRIVDNGRSRAATRGALLASGSTIATAVRARAVLVRGQEFVVISPGSRLRIPEPQQQQRGVIQMVADWGTALFRIERRATPHFGVQTPYLAAVVKGTTFTVTVGESGASVQVTEGAVEVSTVDGGAAELVRPGIIASVAASDLYALSIEGDVSKVIRSEGTPAAGVVTVPLPQAPATGPAVEPILVQSTISEPALDLSESTNGLVDGASNVELAMLDVREVGGGQAPTPPVVPDVGQPPIVPDDTPPPLTPPEIPGVGEPPVVPGDDGPPQIPVDPGVDLPPVTPGDNEGEGDGGGGEDDNGGGGTGGRGDDDDDGHGDDDDDDRGEDDDDDDRGEDDDDDDRGEDDVDDDRGEDDDDDDRGEDDDDDDRGEDDDDDDRGEDDDDDDRDEDDEDDDRGGDDDDDDDDDDGDDDDNGHGNDGDGDDDSNPGDGPDSGKDDD